MNRLKISRSIYSKFSDPKVGHTFIDKALTHIIVRPHRGRTTLAISFCYTRSIPLGIVGGCNIFNDRANCF
jgi:hypothetical protein